MTSHDHRAVALVRLLLVIATALAACPPPALADLMVIGNDEKVVFDAEGNRTFVAPGKDTISIVDITDREAPKILISFPLMNSIFGPPVNLAITPDERLAIVANSVEWLQDGANWKPGPDTKLYVFNLKTSPASHIGTVEIGKQPSGLAINRAGNLALVANRADKSISVLAWSITLVSSEPMERARRSVTLADLTRAQVLLASALSFVARGAIFAIWLLAPFYLVEARGLSPAMGGVFFMLAPLGTAFAAPLSGRLADRVGPWAPAVAGLVIESAGLALLGTADGATPLGLIAIGLFTAGWGVGFFEVPNMAAIMSAFSPTQQGAAGGLSFLARTLGVVVGVASLAEIFAVRRVTVGFLGAFAEAHMTAAIAVAVAALLALAGRRAILRGP